MKVKPKYRLSMRPDKNGLIECPDVVGRRLINAGLAVEVKDSKQTKK